MHRGRAIELMALFVAVGGGVVVIPDLGLGGGFWSLRTMVGEIKVSDKGPCLEKKYNL